jgi:hypothetical protein
MTVYVDQSRSDDFAYLAVIGPLGVHGVRSFAHHGHPTEHAGVARMERAAATIKQATAGSRGMSSLLLAALVAALIVVANQVIDTWTDGHLLAAWVGLWLVAFAALALFAAPVRRAAAGLRATGRAWLQHRRQAVEDERLWDSAARDPRVMSELMAIMDASASKQLRRQYAHR